MNAVTSSAKQVLDVSIFDKTTRKFVNVLQLALLESTGDTHLPEIFEIFGCDAFLKFMDIFAGTTIEVPSLKVIQDSVRNVSIYMVLRKTPVGSRAKKVRELSAVYSIPTGSVRKIFLNLSTRFDKDIDLE